MRHAPLVPPVYSILVLNNSLLTAILFVIGLAVGSFVNVVAIRGKGALFGRSHCPSCRTTLRWYELIPILSYLVLLGRCRTCKKFISPRYIFIEILSGVIFLLAPSWTGIVMGELFLLLGLIDYDQLIIPDWLLICLLLLLPFQSSLHLSSLWCAIGLAGFFFLLWYVSKGKWIGFGDVKLMGVLGLVYGFPSSLLVVYGAILVGGILGALLLVLRRATLTTQVPFGTLLAGSAIVMTLYAQPILHTLWLYFT